MATFCMIGARKESKRIAGKNKQRIKDIPLYQIALNAAIHSGIFSKIVFTSDDNDITKNLSRVPGLLVDKREKELAKDDIVMWEVGTYIMEKYSSEFKDLEDLCFITPCHPFRNANHIREAYSLFKSSDADSLVSITEFPSPPELAVKLKEGKVKIDWQGPVRKDNYQKSFFLNGAVIFVNKKFFIKNKNIYSNNMIGYKMSWPYCFDIDHQQDLTLARTLADKFLENWSE